jgi:endonuclease/exonuclease/phosphatase family metal-dependent hydrolase
VRLLTYNLHKGWSLLNREFVLERMRSLIRTADAEVVFLQEVQGEHSGHAAALTEWPAEPQFEFLADSIWPHYAYGKNAIYSAGHHGNAILSKFPFVGFENIDISNSRFERRGLLHGTIDVPGWHASIHLVCLHLDLFEDGRRRQMERLCARVEEHVPADAPLIIAGDFNDWRGRLGNHLAKRLGLEEAHQRLHGRPARTFPSRWPLLQLDRIYLRGMQPVSATCLDGAAWRSLSDHCPLLAEVAR